jgi:hypothetical protein
MKVRGRVLENRLDLELEKNGDILVNGRNEREIIFCKINRLKEILKGLRIKLQKMIFLINSNIILN